MMRKWTVVLLLALTYALPAMAGNKQPSPNFQSQQFHTALAQVLHARFDDFAEFKTSAAVLQLPQMSCSLAPHERTASYLCSVPASSESEAQKLYDSLSATLAAALPGYPLCHKQATADHGGVTSFCHYPNIFTSDASVQIAKSLVSLEVLGRDPRDQGEPAQFLHAYALAELGRHSDAIQAFEPLLGPEVDRHPYDRERFAYAAALKGTQDCAAEKICMASDFLAIGNTREALRWQNQIFRTIEQEAEANRRRGETLDPASAKSVALADAYDLDARILAAEDKLPSALLALNSAFDALPLDAKAATRKAIYSYHRALILAENKKYAAAARACRESLAVQGIDLPHADLGQPQCLEIDVLASGQPAGGASGESVSADATADSPHDPSIQAEIDEVAGTNNYSALPRPQETQLAPGSENDSPEWAAENGTQFTLHVLISGPSDQHIDLNPGQSASLILRPGKYKVAAVLDRSETLLFYGEQTLQPGRRYTSRFVVPPN